MKVKIDQIRTYDEAGFRRRAACLCFKSECESEVLLVSSSRFHHRWVVPGGGLEPGEDPATTAVREVNEEAGVVGKLGRLLDVFQNNDKKSRTYVFVLVVDELLDDYDDANKSGRLRRWFSIDEALNKLGQHRPVQKEYIYKLCRDEIHRRKVSLCSQASSLRLNRFSNPTSLSSDLRICHLCLRCDGDYAEPANDVESKDAPDHVTSTLGVLRQTLGEIQAASD